MSKAVQADVKVKLVDTDNGDRATGFNPEQSPGDITISDTSNASGILPTAPIDVLTGVWHNNGNNNLRVFRLDDRLPYVGACIAYLYNITALGLTDSKVGTEAADVLLVTDSNLTETTKATVDAYSSIDNGNEFYDRAKAYLYDNYDGESASLVSRNGTLIDAGAFNVVVDATAGSAFSVSGSTITIKSSRYIGDLTTTGTITLTNGAVVIGTRTDSTGISKISTLTFTGLKTNTEVRIYDGTTEVGGVENSGTSETFDIEQNSVDVVIHSLGYLNQNLTVATTTNTTLPVSQVVDRQYNNP